MWNSVDFQAFRFAATLRGKLPGPLVELVDLCQSRSSVSWSHHPPSLSLRLPPPFLFPLRLCFLRRSMPAATLRSKLPGPLAELVVLCQCLPSVSLSSLSFSLRPGIVTCGTGSNNVSRAVGTRKRASTEQQRRDSTGLVAHSGRLTEHNIEV